MEYQDIYGSLDCFSSFKNNLTRTVKNCYFGLACKLRGEGKLLMIWFDLVSRLIDYGKIAVVDYGSYLLLAQVIEGYRTQTGWDNVKLLFLGDKKGSEFVPEKNRFVIFRWGNGETLNMSEFQHDILEMWYLKGLIGWDQDKSKKRVTVEFEKDPGKEGWKNPMQSFENGFIGVISPSKATNQIKKWEYFNPKGGNDERKQLWQDYREAESKFFFHLGIRHNPFAKEERQNNPEVVSGQSYFDAWEVKYQEGIVQGILDFQGKPWGGGKYNLQFGSLPTLLIENQTTQLLAHAYYQNNNQSLLEDNNRPLLEDKK